MEARVLMSVKPPQDPATIARPGAIYRHFKRSLYKVLAIAVHSENGESLVVYSQLSDDAGNPVSGVVWARPRRMFEDGRYRREES
jgi:hypothetical protein